MTVMPRQDEFILLHNAETQLRPRDTILLSFNINSWVYSTCVSTLGVVTSHESMPVAKPTIDPTSRSGSQSQVDASLCLDTKNMNVYSSLQISP